MKNKLLICATCGSYDIRIAFCNANTEVSVDWPSGNAEDSVRDGYSDVWCMKCRDNVTLRVVFFEDPKEVDACMVVMRFGNEPSELIKGKHYEDVPVGVSPMVNQSRCVGISGSHYKDYHPIVNRASGNRVITWYGKFMYAHITEPKLMNNDKDIENTSTTSD